MTDAAEDEKEGAGPLKLASMADADSAKALHAALAERRGADITVDGSGVTFLSALAAQTLCAARDAWRLDGAGFTIEAPSGALTGDLELLGLSSILEPLSAGEEGLSPAEASS